MNRLQISLTQPQYEFLKSESFVLGKSMAAIVRRLLDEIIENRQCNALEADPIWQVIGVGEDITGPTDVSSNLDHYLYGSSVSITPNQPTQPTLDDKPNFNPSSSKKPSKQPTSLSNPKDPLSETPHFDTPSLLKIKPTLEVVG